VVEDPIFFMKQSSSTGGVAGAVIGVSDIEKAKEVYAGILQYNQWCVTKAERFRIMLHYREEPKNTGEYC
jgi:hypothetical protein